MHKYTSSFFILVALFYSIPSFFSQSFIKGKVVEKETNDIVFGALIILDNKNVGTTDVDGNFKIKSSAGNHVLEISMVGLSNYKQTITVPNSDTLNLTVELLAGKALLDEVVISAGRYEQKLSEVTVSMDIIKPSLAENKNTTSLDILMNQVPGVTVSDGQVSMRGGSGFSYGAGSRVLMLVDEMPMISADAGDIKWNYAPLENMEQLEVIKGASSALFGSSALNGVINLRTAYAKDKPITSVSMFVGGYDAPKHGQYKWWKGTRFQRGLNFSHASKHNNFDLVLGGHDFDDEGYRYLETEKRQRFNANMRYNFQKKLKGLAVGVNTNMMQTTGGLFFLWHNYDSAYIPQNFEIQKFRNQRFNIDPYVTYLFGKNNKLSLRTRFFLTKNSNDKNQNSNAELYYSELQYQKHFANSLNITTGAVYMEQQVYADSLYGRHTGKNIAGYFQADKKFFNRLILSAGLRGEYYEVDTAKSKYNLNGKSLPFAPVARFGLNYQAFKYTNIRASFGQGYRFPSVAEKFVSTNVSVLRIFPNQQLQAETGQSTEIGIKQGFKIGDFKGFFDAAYFWTNYENMVEFTFDYYGNRNSGFLRLDSFGFKSQNVGKAVINGFEGSINALGKIGPVNVTLFGGYTYVNPFQPGYDSTVDTLGLPGIKTLKYRNRHLAKGDIQLDYKWFSIGYSCRFQSKVENIDRRFVKGLFAELDPSFDVDYAPWTILPGLRTNFSRFQKDVMVQDLRVSISFSKHVKLSYIVNNFMNEEYQTRPGDVRPPTQHMGQLSFKF
jgi:outer membrane cobalamin receptor